jgi:TfoX/Sxy family transcriptional regulator of competence genes
MGFPKPSDAALQLFETLVPAGTNVAVRRMFGQSAAFVNGQMFFGVFGDDVFVRLSEEECAAAVTDPGFRPFEPMPGRPMREYVVLPGSMRSRPAEARRWVERSLRYAADLPRKRSATASGGDARRRPIAARGTGGTRRRMGTDDDVG